MRISDWSSDVCSSDLAEMVEGTRSNGILVPQGAVSRDEKGSATVLVVGAQNKIEMRKLNAPRTVGTNWLVTAGRKPGDKVVVDGAPMLRPGVGVKAVPPGAPQGARAGQPQQLGRRSVGEGVWRDGRIPVGAVQLKKKKQQDNII